MRPACYYASVRYVLRFPQLTRGLLAAMALLLSLGPFLHGHLGTSHVTGFHLDGIDAAAHTAASAPDHFQAQSDEESPAIGVATSFSKGEKDRESDRVVVHLAVLPAILPAISAQTSPRQLAPSDPPPTAHHLYAVGFPPPALAPPSV